MEGFRQKLKQEGVNEQTLLILEEEDITNTETFCVLWPQHFELLELSCIFIVIYDIAVHE